MMGIEGRPLHKVFVAELSCVGLRDPLDGATVDAIEDAIHGHAVLVGLT